MSRDDPPVAEREFDSLLAALAEAPARALPLEPGARLDDYRVDAHLSSGGMSSVYRGHHHDGRPVAIKLLTKVSSDRQLRARFEQEARALASLRHSNIVGIEHVGSHEGIPYLVLE